MDRYLDRERETIGYECHCQPKLGRGAFMKGMRLHRTPEGKIVATAPAKALAKNHASLEAYKNHGSAINTSMPLLKWPNHIHPAYVVAGDTWALRKGGVCDVWLDAHSGEVETGVDFDAGQLYRTEDGLCHHGTTGDSGRSTPELCWSSTSSIAESIEEMEAEEGVLEMLFHQLIDVAQCDDS
jgi:hypothetical protein